MPKGHTGSRAVAPNRKSLADAGRRCDAGRNSLKVGRHRLKSPTIDRYKSGQHSAEFKIWPKLTIVFRLLPDLGRHWPRVGQIRPKLAQTRPIPVDVGQLLPNIDQNNALNSTPNLGSWGNASATVGQFWGNSWTTSKLVEFAKGNFPLLSRALSLSHLERARILDRAASANGPARVRPHGTRMWANTEATLRCFRPVPDRGQCALLGCKPSLAQIRPTQVEAVQV